jgi:uncharacterized protein (TIGR03067 family)
MADNSDQDLACLQGIWEQVGFEADGSLDTPDDTGVPGALVTFIRNQFSVRTPEGLLLLTGTFTLNASANPKIIDWTDSMGPDTGKTLPAIYRLEADQFVFIAADQGAPRPARFHTVAGQTLRRFVRLNA